ncbi:hypothetical protein MIND_00127800 [Mycena indigotica]|uniref:Uncharacterized protein n=1 Tax=Mycena indigotica TaxID=2126181 RepID=A0A8H6WFT5_9AGAR|nr:uncharacterized protein MIND_00127800 [Mycena indigotica]KAF7316097.1 hypothetical protein MIND_00127800 [Mycena indigotica]
MFTTNFFPSSSVEDWHVVPCTGMDVAMRDYVLTTGFVVNKRLDAKKLEDTLQSVVEAKFPRAGARWVKRGDVHEFFIPKKFNADKRACSFTTTNYEETYNSNPNRPPIDHLRSAHLQTKPFICRPTPPEFDDLFLAPTFPRSPKKFVNTGIPLLHVHASVFDDVTFIGVSAAHVLIDGAGTSTIVEAWTRVLNGESIDNIQGQPWNEDLKLVSLPPEKGNTHSVAFANALSLIQAISLVLRMIYRILFDRTDEPRYVGIPKVFLAEKKKEAMDELRAQGSTEFVGSHDLLYAWWLKEIYASQLVSDTAMLYPEFILDIRKRPIFDDGKPLSTPYINNATTRVYVPPFSFAELRSSSLGQLALGIRRANIEYTSDPTLIASNVTWRLRNPLAAEFPCYPGGFWAVQSDWRQSSFAQMDFSGAASPACKAEEPTRVEFVMVGMLTDIPLPVLRWTHYVVMEDENLVWMHFSRGVKEWEAMRRMGRVFFV